MERFDCRRSVYSLMGSLGIYRLQGSLIEAELESYLCALALVQEELSTLWRDMYIQTASEETVARYERLLSLPFNPKLTLEPVSYTHLDVYKRQGELYLHSVQTERAQYDAAERSVSLCCRFTLRCLITRQEESGGYQNVVIRRKED